MSEQELVDIALKHGAANAAFISVENIAFRREFRAACEQNTCGRFGTCWMCPPDAGDIDELIDDAKGYERAFIFQSIGVLEDSFDIEGMEAAAKHHNDLSQSLHEELKLFFKDYILLGAGSCQVCDECSKRSNEPCRYPDKAIASLEAYGIAVSELAGACGMKYINGQNTVTYFGGFLYNPR